MRVLREVHDLRAKRFQSLRFTFSALHDRNPDFEGLGLKVEGLGKKKSKKILAETQLIISVSLPTRKNNLKKNG